MLQRYYVAILITGIFGKIRFMDQSWCLPIDEWIKKMHWIFKMELYSVIMENKIMSLAKNRLWESLSAYIQTQEDKGVFHFTCGYLSVHRYISKYVYEWYKIVIKVNRRTEVNERVRNRVKEWEGMRDQYGQST